MSNETLMTSGKASFAKVHSPQVSKNYPEQGPQYQVTVVYKDASDPELKKLKDILKANKIKKEVREVLDQNEKHTGEYSFTFNRKAFLDEAGKPQNPPFVEDQYNSAIPTTTLIGNGSTINVAYHLREYKSPNGKTGKTLTFDGIQVTNLVRYESGASRTPKSPFKPAPKPEMEDTQLNENEPW